MKPFITGILLVAVLSVSAFATYDYTITSGFIGTLTLENSETLLMTGGGVNSLTGKDFSVLEIKNTTPFSISPSGGIWTLDLGNWSRLNFSGGHINWFDIDDYATAVLSGGKINTLRNYNEQPVYDKRIEIICKSYDYNTTTKKLTGIWGDDTSFNIQLSDSPQYTYTPTYNILEFTIIPEPTSLLLLAVGGLLIRRK